MKTITNLRAVLEYFEIQNRDLAQAINISPSMVSNWVQGKRALRASSGSAAAIADYILSRRPLTSRDITWFKKHFEQDGITTDFDSPSDIKRNLIIWLADDGQEVLDILKKTGNINIANEQDGTLQSSQYLYSIGPAGRIYTNDYSTRTGALDITKRLGRIFETMAEDTVIDICLSSETASTVMERVFIDEIIKAFSSKNMRVRMLIALSSNSIAVSRIISSYSQLIADGSMEIYISHGMMQPMIHQTSIFIPNTCAVVITELPESFSPPSALFITESVFLKDAENGFDRVIKYAQPLMQFYNESSSRSIVELLHKEYSDEGNLDILSDGVNPFMLEHEEYTDNLKQKGYKGSALDWRLEEYSRIKEGFENNLKRGTIFREIISSEFIKNMVINGSCELSSIYFMDSGKTAVDRKSCEAILKGYIRMMKTYPNYHLAIARQLDENHQGTRHIKHNRHIILNPWNAKLPVLIYSDQMIMIHEFQMNYNEFWMSLPSGNRENTIALLDIMMGEIEKF